MEQLVEAALRQRVFPGLEVLVARADQVLLHQTWGKIEVGPDAADLEPGTLWDIASLTKPMATATSIMILLEKGLVSLEDKVCEWIPEMEAQDKRGITLRHLLTHTSGLPAVAELTAELPPEASSRTEAFQRLINLPLKVPTGQAMVYSCPNFLLLGEVVRRVSGQSLSEFFFRNVGHPLSLTRTAFNPLEQGWNQPIAPTQYCSWRKTLLRGVVHDENAFIFGGEGGNAGLFSTAGDLYRFARMIQRGGELDGVRVLSPLTVEVMTTNHNPPKLAPRGLGWDYNGEGAGYMSCGELFPEGAIGHTGFTGTSLWMEPDDGLIVIMLSNRVHISREKNQPDMMRLRPRLHNLLVSVFGG